MELSRWVSDPSLRDGVVVWTAALRMANAQGSTRIRLSPSVLAEFALSGPVARSAEALAARALGADESDSVENRAESVATSLTPLLGAPEEVSALVLSEGWLSSRLHYALEVRVAARLARLVQGAAPFAAGDVAQALADVLAHPSEGKSGPVTLSEEQAAAVARSAGAGLAVISGGPGTGKTSIVVSLLRVLARLGVPLERVALAAPTGKAADRMRAAIAGALAAVPSGEEGQGVADAALRDARLETQTLHRLLAYSARTRSFRHHERHPLAAQVVVVDEASMIDLGLFDQLLAALAPGSSLVLIGDADQLPSVDVGAVLRDIVDALPEQRSVLTRSYRMDPRDPAGRAVLLAANAVREGDATTFVAHAPLRPLGALEARGAERVAAAEREAFLAGWSSAVAPVTGRLEHAFSFGPEGFHPRAHETLMAELTHSARARLLCATRSRPEGVFATNEWLRLSRRRALGLPEHWRWAPGDPVIVTRNDYDRGLFNGDTGLVARVRLEGEGPTLAALFEREGELLVHPVEALAGRLELAYATTVHKAQGSEYEQVALLLPAEPVPIVGRELLYTALTRARKSAIVVADEDVVRAAIARPALRESGLRSRLDAR